MPPITRCAALLALALAAFTPAIMAHAAPAAALDLTLHVRAPKAGTYLLWMQFMADGQVRTVPFVVLVA